MRSKFKRLRKMMEVELDREITLAEIAEKTGVNINTLSRWDQSKVFKLLDSDVAYALCQYFDVTLNDLVEFVVTEPSVN